MTSLRMVTINTAKGDYAYEDRITWLGQELAALHPDIVLLQEALKTLDDDGAPYDTARHVANALAMEHVVFAPARHKARRVEGQWRDSLSGLAVLSRYRVVQATVIPLPADPADGERICQLVALEVEGSRLLVGNLHLTHLRGVDASMMRRVEVETILDHPRVAHLDGRFVLGGDFNTPLVALPALIDGTDCHLRDTWELGGGSGLRATVPASSPTHCLDYLFSVAADTTGHGLFRDARVVLGEANDAGYFPSDHRGVMVTLTLPTNDDDGVFA